MKGHWTGLICLLTLTLATCAGAQRGSADRPAAAMGATLSPNTAPAPYSKEPYVIEKYTSSMRFENDGTSTRSIIARIRIQSAVAAEKFKERQHQ